MALVQQKDIKETEIADPRWKDLSPATTTDAEKAQYLAAGEALLARGFFLLGR